MFAFVHSFICYVDPVPIVSWTPVDVLSISVVYLLCVCFDVSAVSVYSYV